MATNYSPKIVTDGLVLCLDAGDRKSYSGSGTTWTDRSGNNYNGSISNAVFNSSDKGRIDFDGAGDSVQFNYGLMDSEYITISIWVKPEQGGASSLQGLVTNGYTGTGRRDFNIADNKWQWIQNEYSSGRLDVSNQIDYSIWQNVVATSETSGSDTIMKIYKNSVVIGTKTITGQTFNSGFYGDLGRIGYLNGSRYLLGSIALVHIYDITLTADEILQNYNATKGRFGI